MNTTDFLSLFKGVTGGRGQWSARCPAHDDKHASLSIGQGEKGFVIHCHAGCETADILGSVGVHASDLFYESKEQSAPSGKPTVVATYDYLDDGGKLLAQKLRRSDKSFSWRRPDGSGGWIYNRQGVPHRLYVAGRLGEAVHVCEGEKDSDALHKLGYDAVSGADGAGRGKWRLEYSEQLRGRHVYIFPDNDTVGQAYAQETAAALQGVAASVRMIDLASAWAEIPEHGDISDLVEHFGKDEAGRVVERLIADAKEWSFCTADDPFLSCFKTLDGFDEEEALWLIPGWIPEGQIAVIAADGGIGKTTLWCDIIASISSGTRCILDPPDHVRQPQKVAFLTTEDSVRKKLKKKLRLAGANERNILTPDFLADKTGELRDLKFGTSKMERFIRHYHPALCVFDPIQGFIPPELNMGSRNAMRDCMAPLISLGEEIGTTFIIVCHTNKRKGASGRDRIADSADLWDVARSVIMAGYAEEQGVRYLSNEKNNYATLQQTLLFTIDDAGQAVQCGTSWKRDREYMQEVAASSAAPKRDDCKAWLLRELDESDGSLPSKDLEERAKESGYSYQTLRRAKDELKKDSLIKFFQTGFGKEKAWHIQKTDSFTPLPADTPTPWNE